MPNLHPLGPKRLSSLYLPGGITLLCLAVLPLGHGGAQWLRYQRLEVLHGEWWRLLSAHLVHLGPGHLLMNLLGLWLLWGVFIRQHPRAGWEGATLVSALAVTLGLLAFAPGVQWYVGLSGVLHGLLAFAAVQEWKRDRAMGGLVAFGLIAKLLLEQLHGPLPLTTSLAGGPVVVDAHLYGALGGVLSAAVEVVPFRGAEKKGK